MKNISLVILLSLLSFFQKSLGVNNNYINDDAQMIGCVDLDETLIDLVSIFGDTSLLDGLLGCAELIPTLESGILSAFLPFDIPLNCNTDLTPFGYLEMNVHDVCECSCKNYLEIPNYKKSNRNLLRIINIQGKEVENTKSIKLHIYDDGSIEKKYLLK
tara:strand:+ start:85 stop:561 length:477 start_codon:yes stop_codon:yes gene_type:complete